MAFGLGFFAMMLLLVFGWFLFWPIFVLVWFARGAVQDEVASWR